MRPPKTPEKLIGEKPKPPLLPQRENEELIRREFAKIEKNLASLGFFTPSSKRVQKAKGKTISTTLIINGTQIETRTTIAPAAIYRLPVTADQDKYLALQKLITDLHQRQGGKISNPISFTSAELLALLHQADAGKNYDEIEDWLNVMASTTIVSEGAVYLAGRKRWVKDRFHVFDRAISFGKELEPGMIADKNYVWLSDWQLENINNNYLIPIDLDTYQKLKNHIAKTLVPLLQIWLFASRRQGVFEKRYEELCQMLSIREYQHLSRVKEQLAPSLNELQEHGYLASWSPERTSDGLGFKIIFRHGEKFHQDRKRRLGQKPAAMVAELIKRGVGESGARKLLAKLPADRPILDLLEWGDAEIARQRGKITNPAGFYIRLLEEHSVPPPTFESSQQRKTRQKPDMSQQQYILEALGSDEERERQKAEQHLDVLPPEQYQALFERFKAELFAEHPFMAHQKNADRIHQDAIRARILRYLAAATSDPA